MVDSAAFQLRLIDGFGLFFNDVEIHLSRRKSQALLSYLWLKDSHTETRSRLSTLLWSRSGDGEARVSLRQELSRLNKGLPPQNGLVLNGDKFAIWLSRVPPATDAEYIASELEAGRVPAILLERTLLHEHFLSHFQGIDPELDLWISVQRTAFSRRCLRALAALLQEGSDAKLAKVAARALFNLDPSDESACKLLMELAVAEDNVPEALKLYKELTILLEQDYGAKPSRALIDYACTLTKAAPAFVPQPDAPVVIHERGQGDAKLLLLVHPVAVALPVTESLQRFTVLRSELIGALSKFRDWSVRERSANNRNSRVDHAATVS